MKRTYLEGIEEPMVIVTIPGGDNHTTSEIRDSPELMLKSQLDQIINHVEVGDDFIPSLRVEFGSGQVAHAFGCEMYIPEYSPVCSRGPLQRGLPEIVDMNMPSLDAGWFKKAYEFTEYFMENNWTISFWVGGYAASGILVQTAAQNKRRYFENFP